MPELTISYKSPLPYYVLLFVMLTIWAFIALDLSLRFMPGIYTSSFAWIMVSSGILLIPVLPTSIVIRFMKDSVELKSPSWEFKIREIPFNEFKIMMREYQKGYTRLISRIPYTDIILLTILFVVGVLYPFLLPFDPYLILLSAFLFPVVNIAFALVIAHFLYGAFENNATSEFPYWPHSSFKEAVKHLGNTPGISYTGIRAAIGEAGGYYTIRDPVAVGRIEGIESLARIDIVVERNGVLREGMAFLALGLANETKSKTTRFSGDNTSTDLLDLVRWILLEYTSTIDSKEILADVLDDVGLSTL
ncbi:MAG: hypothetical protein EAX95_05895 [Candidatus Thorarchaeota archaeon]|nr:hypothetical protein [Candidatus Thorarchaeota archaeon]